MANRDNPHGLIPRFQLDGGEIRTVEMDVKATNSEIGIGDPLVMVSDGSVDRAAAGNVLIGVAAHHVKANVGSGKKISVYRDPGIVYSAQTDDGSVAATSQTAVNLNIDFVTGNPSSNGRSITELDESSADVTAILPFKIVGLLNSPDNAYGEFNELLVTINNHKDKGGTGTLGV